MAKKTLSSLLEKISTPQNLIKAWQELNRSRLSSGGLSSETIESFGSSLKSNIGKIKKELRSKSYKFSSTKGVLIDEKKISGKIKKRPIQVSEVRDRLVQRAIARKIEPILNKKFNLRNEASFAYTKKRGVRDALKKVLVLYRKKQNICLEADIKNFFDTVDKEKLLNKIFNALPDKSLNFLLEDALSQKVGNINEFSFGDQSLFSEEGIPQGGALSPLFANIYLSDFDSCLLKKNLNLIRYADDFVVMCKDHSEAQKAHDLSKKILENKLGLKMHPLGTEVSAKTKIVKIGPKAVTFLGATFTGGKIFPRQEAVFKFKSKIREITDINTEKTLLGVLTRLSNLLTGWISAYCYTELNDVLRNIYGLTCERVGVYGYKIDWLKKRGPISKDQYIKAGLPDLNNILFLRRSRLLQKKDNMIFSEFWNKEK